MANNIYYNVSVANVGDKVQNEFDEEWVKLGYCEETKLAERAVSGNSRISCDGVVQVKGDGEDFEDSYLAVYSGGLNGNGEWKNYFKDLSDMMGRFEDAWLISIENDCPDDVFYMAVGFRTNSGD